MILIEMNVKLYRAWIRFVKTRIGLISLGENNIIKDNKHKRIKCIVDFGVHKCYVWWKSKKYWLWVAYKCACKPKNLIWFIFENWNKKLKFCNIFPEVSIYIDLNNLNENIIIEKLMKDISLPNMFEDDDLKHIVHLIAEEAKRHDK